MAWQKLLKMELGSSVTTLRFWHSRCADPIFLPKEKMKRKVYLADSHLTEGLTAWRKLLKMELGSSRTTLRFCHPKCADPFFSKEKNETQGNFGRCSPSGRPIGLAKTIIC